MKLLLYGHLYVVALLNSAFLLMENKKKESKWVCVFASLPGDRRTSLVLHILTHFWYKNNFPDCWSSSS